MCHQIWLNMSEFITVPKDPPRPGTAKPTHPDRYSSTHVSGMLGAHTGAWSHRHRSTQQTPDTPRGLCSWHCHWKCSVWKTCWCSPVWAHHLQRGSDWSWRQLEHTTFCTSMIKKDNRRAGTTQGESYSRLEISCTALACCSVCWETNDSTEGQSEY